MELIGEFSGELVRKYQGVRYLEERKDMKVYLSGDKRNFLFYDSSYSNQPAVGSLICSINTNNSAVSIFNELGIWFAPNDVKIIVGLFNKHQRDKKLEKLLWN